MSIDYGITVFFDQPNEFKILEQLRSQFPFVKYVEFRAETPFLVPGHTHLSDLELYRDTLKKCDLRNTMHATYVGINLATLNPWLKEANIACYRDHIDLAEYLSSEVMVVHGGEYLSESIANPNRNKLLTIAMEHLCESLYELAEYGSKKGVKIAVENLPPEGNENVVFDFSSHISILKAVDHSNLGAIYDMAHAYLYGQDILEYLEKIRPYLFEIHAHNNWGKSDDHLGLTKGEIDYNPILNHPFCKEIPFIMEINSREDIIETLQWIMNRNDET